MLIKKDVDERFYAASLQLYSQNALLNSSDQSQYLPPNFVQSQNTTQGNELPIPATFVANNLAGGMIIVQVDAHSFNLSPINPNTTWSVSDSQGNVYQQVGGSGTLYSYYTGTQQGNNSAVFIAKNIKPGPNTVTATILSGTATLIGTTLNILEYTGNGGIGVTASASVAFTGGYPANYGAFVKTDFNNQIVIFLSGAGTDVQPAGANNRFSGVFDWTIALPINQAYTNNLVDNVTVYAWVIAI